MDYFLLATVVAMASADGLAGCFYNRKNEGKRGASDLFNLIFCLSTFFCWVALFISNPEFDLGVIPYSIAFGVSYAICRIGYINALRTGPISLTTLIVNMALIGTTVWGFFFWGAKVSLIVIVGLVLVAISLWLCLYTKSDKSEGKITFKWIIFVIMAFSGNAGCAIIQRTQQINFDGRYGNQLMVFAIGFSAIFTLVLFLRGDRRNTKNLMGYPLLFPVVAGLSNASVNLIIIYLATSSLSSTVVYPVIAVGTLSFTTLVSILLFREKLRVTQWIGVAIGAIAVAILSI